MDLRSPLEIWRIVGVLDSLGQQVARCACLGGGRSLHSHLCPPLLSVTNYQGYSAVAVDLPKKKAANVNVQKEGWLVRFTLALGLRGGASVVLVSADLGGLYAAPFLLDPGPFLVSGYVTVAGALPQKFAPPLEEEEEEEETGISSHR